MVIEIEDIKKALRSGKYSEMQSNIDTGDIENDSKLGFKIDEFKFKNSIKVK